jgi:hypothetical protein
MAFKLGCDESFVYEMQQVTLPTIKKYHERFFLHEWIGLQVLHACYKKQPCISYAEYLLEKVRCGEMRLDSDLRVHSIEFLEGFLTW